MRKNTPDSFWLKIEKTDGCWLWSGAKFINGYGKVRWLGVSVYTHRLAYQLVCGDIPAGQQVCHRCDTPLCVRPDHLFLGTFADNMKDKLIKKRQSRGEQISKLTEQQVAEIRRSLSTGTTQARLATIYGVDQSTISNIHTGRNWGWT